MRQSFRYFCLWCLGFWLCAVLIMGCTPTLGTPTSGISATPGQVNSTIAAPTASNAIANAIATPMAPLISFDPRQAAQDVLPRLIIIVIILAGSWGVSTLVRKLIVKILARVNSQVRIFTARLVYFAIWIGAVLWVLSVFQVQVATLTAIVGTLGLALSLASQDLAKNFIAGIYLLIEHPFKVGDIITFGTFVGKVEFIDLRTTIITTDDDQQVIIPNALLLSQVVTRRMNSTPRHENPPKL